jgi:hypothetical protein
LPRTRRCQRQRHAPGRQRRGNIRSHPLKSSPSPGSPRRPRLAFLRATGTPRSAPLPEAPTHRSPRTAAA